jgi:hypothetical protein
MCEFGMTYPVLLMTKSNKRKKQTKEGNIGDIDYKKLDKVMVVYVCS